MAQAALSDDIPLIAALPLADEEYFTPDNYEPEKITEARSLQASAARRAG